MGLIDFVRGELLEIVEWTDDTRDTLAWRFPDQDRAIRNGARLVVRESQVAQFVYLGVFGDTFGPGTHRLTTDNIPVLTTLASWPYGFDSPFKADVYFVTTRLFTGNRWGTSNPVMLRDDDFGAVRLRAFGTYDFRIVDPRTFLREAAGSDHDVRLDEFATTMRSRIVAAFTEAVARAGIPVLDVAARYRELGAAVLPAVNQFVVPAYGFEITSFVVENVSLPAEVESAIDARAGMAAVGSLNDFVKYNLGRGLDPNGGEASTAAGVAGGAAALVVGLGLAQQMLREGTPAAQPPASAAPAVPDLVGVADAALALGVSEADVLAVLEAGELKGRKIGSTWRIPRSALISYLS